MDPRTKLREQATALEESGDLQRAVDLYEKLATTGENATANSVVWNRIGNLRLRLGRSPDALEAYEKSAGLFADAGLPNTSIALYRKIVRAEPGRAEAYLELARLGKEQRYARDARKAIDEYSRIMGERGESAEAALALEGFVEPDVAEDLTSPFPPESPNADVSHLLMPNTPAEAGSEEDLPVISPIEGLESSSGADVWDQVEEDQQPTENTLPLLDESGEEAALIEDPDDLPFLDTPVAPEEGRLDLLRRRVQVDETDLDARTELVRLLQEQGQNEEARRMAEDLHQSLAAAGRYDDAAEMVGMLIEEGAAHTGLLQKRVEYASLSGEQDQLIAAYHSLARHLEKPDGGGRAEVVYRRILEMDPEDEAAQAAPTRAARKKSAREYVDFAAMVLEEEQESGTRFTVQPEEPTGDEDRDFANILSVFRQKLSKHIDASDAASHYDMGLAFKEMGLLDEAVAEFQVALRAGANPVGTMELLGECFCEQGRPTLTVRVLDYALKLKASNSEFLGVYYWLARAEATLGNMDRAQDLYERITAMDVRFRDVAERLRAIRGGPDVRPL